MGPVHMSLSEQHTANIPLWLGVAAIAIGGVVFIYGGKRR